jgi:O-antigen/teichoic acid export membrane protein
LSQTVAYRSFLRSAAYIFAVKLFPAIANIAVLILFSRWLPESDYGHYQNFWVRLLLLGTVACAGLPVFILTYSVASLRYLFLQLKARHFMLWTTWVVICALVAGWLESNDPGTPFILVGLLLACYVINAIQEALIMASGKFRAIAIVSILYSVAFLLLHVLIFRQGYDLTTLLSFLLTAMVLRIIALVPSCLKLFRSREKEEFVNQDIPKARSLWMHLGFYDVSQVVFRWLDKFVVSLIVASGISAIYFNGSIDIPFLPLLLGAAGSAVLIQLAKTNSNDDAGPVALMNTSGRLLSCIVFPLFYFFLCFRHELFSVVLTDKYSDSVPIFFASLFVLPLRAYSFTTLLQNRKQGALINKGAVMDLVIAIALIYPLYRLLGLPGIAFSFVVSTYIQSAYYLYHTSRIFKVNAGRLIPFTNWLLKLLVLGLLFSAIHYLLTICATPEIILALGAALTLLVVMILAALEYKLLKQTHG